MPAPGHFRSSGPGPSSSAVVTAATPATMAARWLARRLPESSSRGGGGVADHHGRHVPALGRCQRDHHRVHRGRHLDAVALGDGTGFGQVCLPLLVRCFGAFQHLPLGEALQSRVGRQFVEQRAGVAGQVVGRERYDVGQDAEPVGQDRVEQGFLGTEVGVDRLLVRRGGGCDAVDPGPGESDTDELVVRRGQQPRAGGGGVVAHTRHPKTTRWFAPPRGGPSRRHRPLTTGLAISRR